MLPARVAWCLRLAAGLSMLAVSPFQTPSGDQRTAATLPAGRLSFGAFTARFGEQGAFTLEGDEWPAFRGTWKTDGAQVELVSPAGPNVPDGCDGPGRYRFHVEDRRVSFDLVSDGCEPRRMILDRSTWGPAGEPKAIAPQGAWSFPDRSHSARRTGRHRVRSQIRRHTRSVPATGSTASRTAAPRRWWSPSSASPSGGRRSPDRSSRCGARYICGRWSAASCCRMSRSGWRGQHARIGRGPRWRSSCHRGNATGAATCRLQAARWSRMLNRRADRRQR